MEPTMVKISATTVPKIKTKGLVRKLEKQSTVSGQSRTKLCNAYAPAHVLAFTLAARPILRAILRVRRGLARTYEARTASFVSLDTRAVSRARVGRVGAYVLRGETQRVRADGGNRGWRREGRLVLPLLHGRMDCWVGEDNEIEVGFVHCAAQRGIERCCGGRVLFAVPSVGIGDAAEASNAKRAKAVP